MGIQGLLPQLKSIVDQVELKDYAGMTVGVDASVWLHRGVYGCATQLALGQRTDAFVRFCEQQLSALFAAGVTPYVVFDGGLLPMKAGTEAARRAERDKAMAAGREALGRGDAGAAHAAFTRAVDVTPAMAAQLAAHLRARGVAFVFAPYEADAQLAYLAKRGLVQARTRVDMGA